MISSLRSENHVHHLICIILLSTWNAASVPRVQFDIFTALVNAGSPTLPLHRVGASIGCTHYIASYFTLFSKSCEGFHSSATEWFMVLKQWIESFRYTYHFITFSLQHMVLRMDTLYICNEPSLSVTVNVISRWCDDNYRTLLFIRFIH